MKRVITLMIALVMAFGMNSMAADTTLTDISGHWAESNIEKLVELGIVSGYPDGTFRPNGTITVAEFTKMVVSAIGFEDIELTNKEHWSESYMFKGKELALFNYNYYPYIFNNFDGLQFYKENKVYYVDQPINREQMATIIVAAYEYYYDETIPVNADYSGGIKDFAYLLGGNERAILKSYEVGLIAGQGEGVFNSQGNATRAEASTVILRLLDADYRVATEITEEMKANAFILEPEITEAERQSIFTSLESYDTLRTSGDLSFDEAIEVYDEKFGSPYSEATKTLEMMDVATGTISAFYNTDYRYTPTWDKDNFLYFVHSGWWYVPSEYGSDDGIEPLDLYDVLLEEGEEYHRISRQFFLTDTVEKDMIYTNMDQHFVTRGRYYFIFDSHDKNERIDNELEGYEGYDFVYETGQWYYVDAEVITQWHWNPEADWEKADGILNYVLYLGEPTLVE